MTPRPGDISLPGGRQPASGAGPGACTSRSPEGHSLRAPAPRDVRAGRGQAKTMRGVVAVSVCLSPEGPSSITPIARWQAGRSPRIPSGEAACHPVTLGAGRLSGPAPTRATVA